MARNRIAEEFEKDLLRAKKKVGREVGRKIVKEQQRLVKARYDVNGTRRTKAIRNVIAKDGTLILFDHFPGAAAQEEGETIRAKSGGWLFISFLKGRHQDYRRKYLQKSSFVKKKGNKLIVFTTAERGEIGEMTREYVNTRSGSKPTATPIGVLLRDIRIKKGLGFYETVERHIGSYVSDIEREVLG